MLHALITLLLVTLGTSSNVGWKSYMRENPTEFHDLPLSWETGIEVPEWLSGTYVRNGPAQISFGSKRRHMSSWLEGFGKLHSFKLDGPKVLYSGKMLDSPNYVASKEKGELVPMVTLNKFDNEEDEWTWWEKLHIIFKMFIGDEMGNNNPALWRIGSADENGIYMAVTDAKVPTRFNISDLSTIGQEYPPSYPFTLNGCAHWMREPGTDNSINFNYRKGITGPPWVEVLRYRPEHTYQTPEVIATFKPTKFSYIHSFSVTENYVVLMFYPVVINPKKYPESNFHAFELFESNQTDTTDTYVIHTKTGAVQGPFRSAWQYSAHHMNAYESSESEIIMDITPTPFENMRSYVSLENMMNPPEDGSPELMVSTTGGKEIVRYTLDLKETKIVESNFPNTINSRYINTFDFPMINEAYRGKKYCYLYGVSAFAYSRTALVKKNVCDSTDDKVYYVENNYMSEMHFLPDPSGKSEDDGVLITIGFDGVREQSYLLLINATTFTPMNKAFLPHNIPWSAHGMHFPETGAPLAANKKRKQTKEEL